MEECIERYLDGEELDDAEARRLCAWVNASMHNARALARRAFDHRRLRDTLAGQSIHRELTLPPSRRLRPATVRVISRFAAAAVLVFGFVATISVLMKYADRSGSPPAPAVATLIDEQDAAWDGPAPSVGSQLPGGWLRLTAGSAQIEFFSGARVTMRGPCEFGLNSRMRGELRRGTILAEVPPPAHGFTVAAPGLAVVDLGTRFQLDVDNSGASNLHVIEGKVDVAQLDAAGGEITRQTLTQGQISRVADGRLTIQAAPPTEARRSSPTLNLADGDFEHLPEGATIPHQLATTGVWSGDLGTVVGAERGVKPYHGKHMLRFDAAGRSPGAEGSSEVRQIVALPPARPGEDPAAFLLSASAQFNRIDAGPQTDTLFQIAIEQFDVLPPPTGRTKPLSIARSPLISDSDPSTWQRAAVTVPLKPDARFAVVTVLAMENVRNDETGPEFAGHYADDVKFQITTRETPQGKERQP